METPQDFVKDWALMLLEIVLDDKNFHCLKRCIPRGSRSKLVLDQAVGLKFSGNSAVIRCNEAEARNLLIYAGHCRGAVASIEKALHVAGLPLEYSMADRRVAIQPHPR